MIKLVAFIVMLATLVALGAWLFDSDDWWDPKH